MAHGGQSVGNHQRRAALHQRGQGLLHQPFGVGVQGRGGFVKNENRRVFVHRAGNRQALALAAGKLHGVVADHGVDALRQGNDKLCEVGRLQAGRHAGAVNRHAQRNIVGHAVVDHQHMLADHGELLAQRLQRPLADVVAIDQNGARGGINKPRQQVDQRCLARTRGADQGHGFARLHRQAEIVDGRRGSGGVGHRDVGKGDVATGTFQRKTALGFIWRGVDQVQRTFQRRQAARDRAGHFGELANRRDDHQHRRDKRDKAADRRAAAGVLALNQRHGYHRRQSHGSQHLCHGCCGGAGHGGFHGDAAQGLAKLAKTVGLRRLCALQPNVAVRQHVFFNDIGQLVGGVLAGAG